MIYEYRWNRMGRKGEFCRVLVRGKMNSCLVEFLTDGFQAVTSRNALRKINLRNHVAELLNRLNSGNPNYTPYQVEEKK